MTVEIIIPTWNGLEDTIECIASIKATVNEPYRLIIIDNGSTDGTIEWVEEKIKNGANMKLIKEKNINFSTAVNKAMGEATEPYVFCINNDIICYPNWHANMLAALQHNKDFALMASTTDLCGEHLQWFPYAECIKPSMIEATEVNFVCILIDRAFWQAHLMDEQYVSGVEDIDYCWTILKENRKIGICLASWVHHKGEKTNKRERPDRAELLKKQWGYFATKWGDEGKKRANQYAHKI